MSCLLGFLKSTGLLVCCWSLLLLGFVEADELKQPTKIAEVAAGVFKLDLEHRESVSVHAAGDSENQSSETSDSKQEPVTETETQFQPDVLFLLSGQSNMAGNGFSADLSPGVANTYRSPPANVAIWEARSKQWKPVSLGAKFGPEVGFAHAIAAAFPNKKIGLIKFAAGGTSMDRWHPQGELYARWKTVFKEARARAPKAELAAMLWHQGESDSDTIELADAYQQKLIQHIQSIRDDTGQADLLFLFGQINPAASFMGRPRFQQADRVRRAQADLKVDKAVMIETDDCEKNVFVRGDVGTPSEQRIAKNADNIHYSAAGQLKLGQRFADVYLKHRLNSTPGLSVSPLRSDDRDSDEAK